MTEKERGNKAATRLKAILVNAGPHKHGCTARALREVASMLEVESVRADIFWVGTRPIASCMGCKKCAQLGRCVFEDRVNEFASIATDYDAIVIGSPCISDRQRARRRRFSIVRSIHCVKAEAVRDNRQERRHE